MKSNKRIVIDMKRNSFKQNGQACIEYVVIGVALICVIGALGALWHCISDGTFTDIIQSSSSHSTKSVEGITDVLLY